METVAKGQELGGPTGKPKCKSVILLFLFGGPSQLETFDMKPDAPAEVRGEFQPIPSSVPGLQICEHLPHLARVMHKVAVIRSMHHNNRLHDSASTEVLTGRQSPQGDREEFAPIPQFFPSYGAGLSHAWRDQRLNMIHEGTHGIQALDLLGRKVVQQGGASLAALAARVQQTIERAIHTGWAPQANQLAAALAQVGGATKKAWSTGEPEEALANAVPYLQAFGHTVLAWIWLDVALSLADRDDDFARGKRAAQRYFFAYELPRIHAWLGVVARREPLTREMQDAWF